MNFIKKVGRVTAISDDIEATYIRRINFLDSNRERVLWSIPSMIFKLNQDGNNTFRVISSPRFTLLDDKWTLFLYGSSRLSLFLSTRIPPKSHLQYRIYFAIVGKDVHEGKLDSYGHFEKLDFVYLNYVKFDNGALNLVCVIEKVVDFTGSISTIGSVENPEMEESETDVDESDVDESDVDESDVDESDGDESGGDKSGGDKKKVPEVRGPARLTQDLKNLFMGGQSKDVVLKTKEREFPAHKAILIARSPVFALMFQVDMAERSTGIVDIPDCSADAFQVFLLHLYTGTADGLSLQNVFNVYYAADKYQMKDLKEDCVKFMINTLSTETFCDVITISLLHSELELQKTATQFFCANIKKIINTVQWQKYLVENPTQANELFIKAINA